MDCFLRKDARIRIVGCSSRVLRAPKGNYGHYELHTEQCAGSSLALPLLVSPAAMLCIFMDQAHAALQRFFTKRHLAVDLQIAPALLLLVDQPLSLPSARLQANLGWVSCWFLRHGDRSMLGMDCQVWGMQTLSCVVLAQWVFSQTLIRWAQHVQQSFRVVLNFRRCTFDLSRWNDETYHGSIIK